MKGPQLTQKIINPLDCVPIKVLRGHKAPIYIARFNKDGQYVMTGSQDRSIILWNPYKELQIKVYSGAHNYEITDVAITDDNNRFISVGGDKYGFLWDIATGSVIRKFGSHHSRINCCAIGGETSLLATGGYDCEVRFWDLKDRKASYCIQKIKECKDSVTSLAFDKHSLIVSSMDGKIRTFDIRMGCITEDSFNIGILNCSLSHDNRLLTLSCQDRIFERDTGQVLTVLSGSHTTELYSLQTKFSLDDAMVLTGSDDGNIGKDFNKKIQQQQAWYDLVKGRSLRVHKAHVKAVSSIDFSSQGNGFITASYDGSAILWGLGAVDQE